MPDVLEDRHSNNIDQILNLLLQLYCILLPFEEALAGAFGSVVKLVGVAIIAYVMFVYKRVIIRRINQFLILWMILAAVSGIWADSLEWWMMYMKIYASQLAFLLLIVGVPVDSIDLKKIRNALIVSSIITSLIIILFPQASGFTADGRRTIILFGHVFDPNIVSGILILGIAAALEDIFKLGKGKARNIRFGAIMICFVGIFYTGSRGGLISAIVTVALSVFLEMKEHESRRLARRIVLLGAIAAIAIIPFLPSSLIEGRFSASTFLGFNEYSAGVHNRYSVWISAMRLVPSRPLFGYGIGNFLSAITKVYYRSCAAHNLYILALIETGIIGLFLMVLFLQRILKSLRLIHAYTTYGMFVGIMVMSLTLDSLPYKYFWIAIIYAELIIYSSTHEDSKQEKDHKMIY